MRPPDSYTLLLLTPSNVINATLYETLNFDFTRHTSPGGIISVSLAVQLNLFLHKRTKLDVLDKNHTTSF